MLKETEEGKIEPTDVAKKYKEKYIEMAIDEYQDSNLVQEYILNAVSKGDNKFMVGDVKQSIYRFRLARPELFMEKYKSYSTEEAQEQRIDLHKNFRSRAEVLDADAFSLFKQQGIFNREVADSFRNNILSKGGTEHPMVLYKRFRGQEPTIDALLIRNGIKKQYN